MNNMSHILRAHQLCNAGYQVWIGKEKHEHVLIWLSWQVLFNDKLSTVWSAPNYCYRCGNLASILEVGVDGSRFFNVFDAAPENDRNPQQAQLKVRVNVTSWHYRPYIKSSFFFLYSKRIRLNISFRLALHYCTGKIYLVDKASSMLMLNVAQGCGEISVNVATVVCLSFKIAVAATAISLFRT